MADPWYDDFHAAYARNLGRVLNGKTLTVNSTRDDGDDITLTVERIKNVTVGIDSKGIFAGITVVDTHGVEFTLYGDGSVTDDDDRVVGSHAVAWKPAPNNSQAVV